MNTSTRKQAGQMPSDDSAAPLRRAITDLLPDLRAFARFLARDRTLADDLVQEALVRALGALHQFHAGTDMKAWLFTILRNVFYEQGRRRRTEQAALAIAPAQEIAGDPAQDSKLELADLERLLWSLPPLLREALVLVGAQGMDHDQAAAICGVPIGTMKSRVSRARARMARELRGEGREVSK
jgi:RNA polymerase sigma-70 factor (ECF subfamily)